MELSKFFYQDNQINPPNPFYKFYPYIPFNPFNNINNEPNERLPRKDYSQFGTQNQGIKKIPIDIEPKFMDITFVTNTGFKIVLTIPKNTTIIQMCIMYMDRLGLPHDYIGNKIKFLYNANLINPFMNQTIFNLFQTNVSITVFDQDEVISPEIEKTSKITDQNIKASTQAIPTIFETYPTNDESNQKTNYYYSNLNVTK